MSEYQVSRRMRGLPGVSKSCSLNKRVRMAKMFTNKKEAEAYAKSINTNDSVAAAKVVKYSFQSKMR